MHKRSTVWRKLASLDPDARTRVWAEAFRDDPTATAPAMAARRLPRCGHRGSVDEATGLCLVCAAWQRHGLPAERKRRREVS